MDKIINFFDELKKEDVPLVGGKGANLGEMSSAKIPVPEGFVINVNAYKLFLNTKINGKTLGQKISEILSKTNIYDENSLNKNTKEIRDLMMSVQMPKEISDEIKNAYKKLCGNKEEYVAVRSSATAEDVPEASFAGQQDTYLNIKGEDNVIFNVQKCWASLFSPRATFYRQEQGFDHMETYLAVVIQRMINSTVSGVMFTADPVTGEQTMIIEAAFGLGEGVVGGIVTPDTYIIDKNSMRIIDKKISVQKIGIVRKEGITTKAEINLNYQDKQKLSDDEILNLVNIGISIEKHYKQPMDIEWCTENNKIYIVQARPVTTIKKETESKVEKHEETEKKVLVKGLRASPGIGKGVVKIVRDVSDLVNIKEGDVLVTLMTTPDMVPAMKRARAIVTDEGGMTCHAAIVSRELGIPCVVGTKNATKVLKDGIEVTVDGNKGVVYEGFVEMLRKGVEKHEETEKKVLVKGLRASPGIGKGVVKIVRDVSDLVNIKEGDVLVTLMTTPDMVPAMKRARAIVTDEGGMTCHAAIVSRELGIPCVVGTKNATKVLKDGIEVTVDGNKGVVYEGVMEEVEKAKELQEEISVGYEKVTGITTATEVKANVDFGHVAEKAKALGADGVGLLRAEHMFLEIGEHPNKLIKEGRREELIKKIMSGIRAVAEVMYPNPVWYRTLDLKTDEFKGMIGGEDEPVEANPMIGWRGIRRSLDEVEVIKCEFEAIKRLREEERLTNIGIMLPMVQHVSEFKKAKELAIEVGLNVENMDFGIMIEIPAAALTIDDFIKEGINFVSFGTNDLTQFTLALDRNSAHVAKLYNEQHPAVLKLIQYVIERCKEAGVKTSVCGQAGSDPKMVEKLVTMGIDSVSANIDAVLAIRSTCARIEKKLLLESARKNFKR